MKISSKIKFLVFWRNLFWTWCIKHPILDRNSWEFKSRSLGSSPGFGKGPGFFRVSDRFAVWEFENPGFGPAEFQIRARFRVQDKIFLRVEKTWVLKTRVKNFRAGSPGPLPSPAHPCLHEVSNKYCKILW